MNQPDAIRSPKPVDSAASTPADVAQQILRESPYHALRRVRCSYRDGVLTMDGSIPSFYLKQLAQTAVQNLPGVERLDNRLEVTI